MTDRKTKQEGENTYQKIGGWLILCAIGLILGLVNYFLMRRTMDHIGSEPA